MKVRLKNGLKDFKDLYIEEVFQAEDNKANEPKNNISLSTPVFPATPVFEAPPSLTQFEVSFKDMKNNDPF